jgi:hypothetical protein
LVNIEGVSRRDITVCYNDFDCINLCPVIPQSIYMLDSEKDGQFTTTVNYIYPLDYWIYKGTGYTPYYQSYIWQQPYSFGEQTIDEYPILYS